MQPIVDDGINDRAGFAGGLWGRAGFGVRAGFGRALGRALGSGAGFGVRPGGLWGQTELEVNF